MSDSSDNKPDSLDKPMKKKRRRLSAEERIKIIDRLVSGYSNTRLAQEFGVSGAAITKIGKNIENYINCNQASDSDTGRRSRVMDHTAFEKAIFKWYRQKRCLCEAVPVHILRDKAMEINEKMNVGDTFRAGNSWLQRFKDRHSIRNFPTHKSDVEDEVATSYCKELIKLIEEQNIDPDNIYNADETVLAWRSIPKERSLYKRKAATANVDTVTVMVCSNATGTHKLPLMIIGTDDLQDTLEEQSLPFLVYKSQPDALMNQEIFSEWYMELFLPEIRDRHANDSARCILLIDSAPPHSSIEALNKEDDICEVRPIHFEITPQIQPLNQGIIRSLKAIYKSCLINKVLEHDPPDIDTFCYNFSLVECCELLADAWNDVSETDVKAAWQKVIVPEEQRTIYDEERHIEDLVPLLRKLPSCSRYNKHNTRDWVEEEADQPGWEILTDEEILNEVMRDHRETIKDFETQIQDKKKRKRGRKPLSNNNETSPNPETPESETQKPETPDSESLEPEAPEPNAYTPNVIIKEEVEELMIDEPGIKVEMEEQEEEHVEEEEEPSIVMERNAVYLDEYTGSQLQPEDGTEQDILRVQQPIPILSKPPVTTESNIVINDVRTGAYGKVILPRPANQDTTTKKYGAPSAFDAMTSIDVVYRWFEKKPECKQEDLIRLRQMREIARKEILVTVNKP